MIFAVFIVAAQFSTASADVAFPERYRTPVSPVNLSVISVDETNRQVIIEVRRRVDSLKSYSCKVYRVSDSKQFFECESNFEEDISIFGFYYKDLNKDTPYNLVFEFDFNYSDKSYRFNSRPLLQSAKYEISFERYKNELRAQIFSVE